MALLTVPIDQVIEVHANELAQRSEAISFERCEFRAPADAGDIEAHDAARHLPVLLHGTASTELR
jgi:hypothetical protein